MICHSFPVGLLGCNCVILGDQESREAVVVDPGGDAHQILMRLAKDELRLVAVVHTHGHVDHVAGTGELVRVTSAPTYLHPADQPLFERAPEQGRMFGLPSFEPAVIDHALEDGGEVTFGSHVLRAIHTPGHSPGSVSLLAEDLCLCGDTLFAGGVGRTDIWGGDFDTLARSIRERLYTLDGGTRVIPGHGPMTTIDTERRHNPFVRGQ